MRPNALHEWDRLRAELAGRHLAVFLDYDGTLTPIVDRPELARLSEAMRKTLRALSEAWPTHVVSGRGLEDVKRLVGLETIVYAASHGFDLAGPGLRREVHPEVTSRLADAARALETRLASIPGAVVEDKRFSVAVHYRQVEVARIGEIERVVDAVVGEVSGVRKTGGKKVFEVRPSVSWDKGRAVLLLLQELDRSDVAPIYVGDDVTDEDAFRALEHRGVGVRVGSPHHESAARYTVQDVSEVAELLRRLARWKATPS